MQRAQITNPVSASVMVPTKCKSGWDYSIARDIKAFDQKGASFLVVFPTEWSNDEYNALLIDANSGAVCAIAKEDISVI